MYLSVRHSKINLAQHRTVPVGIKCHHLNAKHLGNFAKNNVQINIEFDCKVGERM